MIINAKKGTVKGSKLNEYKIPNRNEIIKRYFFFRGVDIQKTHFSFGITTLTDFIFIGSASLISKLVPE